MTDVRDPMAGKRFDGNDRDEDEVLCFGGSCLCGAPAGLRHTHDRSEDRLSIVFGWRLVE